jgi:hypothetical protein
MFTEFLIDKLVKHKYIKKSDSDDEKKKFCEIYLRTVNDDSKSPCDLNEKCYLNLNKIELTKIFDFEKNRKIFDVKIKKNIENIKLKVVYSKTGYKTKSLWGNELAGRLYGDDFEVNTLYTYDNYIIYHNDYQDLKPWEDVHDGFVLSYYKSISDYLDSSIIIALKSKINTQILDSIFHAINLNGVIKIFKSLFDDHGDTKFLEYCKKKYEKTIVE